MRHRMLIVDDEAPIRSALHRYFVRQGWAVDCACNAEEALAQLGRSAYDLVLTDLRLGPGADGWTVVAQVRSQCPDTPVAIITGLGGRITEQRAGRAGADAIFEKPIELAVLGRAVLDLMTRRRRQPTGLLAPAEA